MNESDRSAGGGEGDRRRRPDDDPRRRRRRRRRPPNERAGSAGAQPGKREQRSQRGKRQPEKRQREKSGTAPAASIVGRHTLLGLVLLSLVLIGLAVAALFIFRPFLSPLITAVVMTTVAYPLYQKILSLVGGTRRGTASGLACLALVVLVFAPVVWFGWALAQGASTAKGRVYGAIQGLDTRVERMEETSVFKGLFFYENGAKRLWWTELLKATKEELAIESTPLIAEEPAGEIADPSGKAPGQPKVEGGKKVAERTAPVSFGNITRVATWVTGRLASLLAGVLGVVIKFILMLFFMYYFFKDGAQILASVMRSLPVDASYQDKVIKKIQSVTRGVVRGTLLTALIQGGVAAVAFLFLGIHALFWGAMVALSSLIPGVGTGLVTIPLTISFILNEQYVHAVALAVIAVVISSLDNLVRPYLLEGDLELHPVWILIAILGGVGCFGVLGLVLGPLVVVLLRTVLALVAEETRERAAQMS